MNTNSTTETADLGPLPEPFQVYQYANEFDRMPLYAPRMDRPSVPVYTAAQLDSERRRCFALGAERERERCKAAVQYSQCRNGYHEDEHGQKVGHYSVRMFEWIDSGFDPRAEFELKVTT